MQASILIRRLVELKIKLMVPVLVQLLTHQIQIFFLKYGTYYCTVLL